MNQYATAIKSPRYWWVQLTLGKHTSCRLATNVNMVTYRPKSCYKGTNFQCFSVKYSPLYLKLKVALVLNLNLDANSAHVYQLI
jgi:hypothetical protein